MNFITALFGSPKKPVKKKKPKSFANKTSKIKIGPPNMPKVEKYLNNKVKLTKQLLSSKKKKQLPFPPKKNPVNHSNNPNYLTKKADATLVAQKMKAKRMKKKSARKKLSLLSKKLSKEAAKRRNELKKKRLNAPAQPPRVSKLYYNEKKKKYFIRK